MNNAPAGCHRATTDEYCRLLELATDELVAVARATAFDVELPSCPGWTVATVVEHVGGLHRWAESHVHLSSLRHLRPAEIEDRHLPSDGEWETWLRDGAARLVRTLRAADPDRQVWAWGADKHVRFWGRRMVFETTIHRADVEIALERDPQIDGSLAVDGLDEFLDNLPHAVSFAPMVKELRGSGETLSFVASDIDVDWTIRLHDDGFSWGHAPGTADVSLAAGASDLLLFAYGRFAPAAARIDIDGDMALLEKWRTHSAL